MTDAARESAPVDEAYRLALLQIEADGERINRLQRALRVANHRPHDQAGPPNEGFPTCSVCGAIQTGESAPVGPGLLRARGRSIFVRLTAETIEALQASAQRDDRTVKGQAAYLIRRGLAADGLLADPRRSGDEAPA